MALIFDIETTSLFKDEEHKKLVTEERRDKRLTDPKKKAENESKILRDAALSPYTGMITVIGFYDTIGNALAMYVNKAELPFETNVTIFQNEKEMLEQAWLKIDGYLRNGDTLVGFKSKDFDLPYMFVRSLINHVEAKGVDYMQLMHPYSHDLHLDINAFFQKGSLKEISYALDCQTDNDTDGSELPELWKSAPDEVIMKCKSDLIQTNKIYERIKPWIPQRLVMSSSSKTDFSI